MFLNNACVAFELLCEEFSTQVFSSAKIKTLSPRMKVMIQLSLKRSKNKKMKSINLTGPSEALKIALTEVCLIVSQSCLLSNGAWRKSKRLSLFTIFDSGFHNS